MRIIHSKSVRAQDPVLFGGVNFTVREHETKRERNTDVSSCCVVYVILFVMN